MKNIVFLQSTLWTFVCFKWCTKSQIPARARFSWDKLQLYFLFIFFIYILNRT